jgi:hypothetical protein
LVVVEVIVAAVAVASAVVGSSHLSRSGVRMPMVASCLGSLASRVLNEPSLMSLIQLSGFSTPGPIGFASATHAVLSYLYACFETTVVAVTAMHRTSAC